METFNLAEAIKGFADQKHYTLWRGVPKGLERNAGGDHFERALRQLNKRAVADSSSTSAIVPEELAPDVIPYFVQKFPLYDLLDKRPANGLSETFQRWTGYSTEGEMSSLIAETDSVNDDSNEYERETSPISTFAQRRGITIKARAAGEQAGAAGGDLMDRELRGAMFKIGHDLQVGICRYQSADSTSTTVDAENGKYSKLAFNGLRYILNSWTAPANNPIVDTSTPWTDQRVLKAVRKMTNQVTDLGGEINLLVCTTYGSEAMFEDQIDLVRYVDNTRVDIAPGRSVRVINTDAGPIPVLVVPGDSIGKWNDGSHDYVDIFGINTEGLYMPYLGNPMPSVLRIPTGSDGTLRDLAIPFIMLGLVAETPNYMFRVSLQLADS